MTDILTRIAIAISGKGQNGWAALPDTEKDRLHYSAVWHDAGETKADYLDDARAALEAMLEPTEEMVEVGDCGPFDGEVEFDGPSGTQVWQAMIRTALEEKP